MASSLSQWTRRSDGAKRSHTANRIIRATIGRQVKRVCSSLEDAFARQWGLRERFSWFERKEKRPQREKEREKGDWSGRKKPRGSLPIPMEVARRRDGTRGREGKEEAIFGEKEARTKARWPGWHESQAGQVHARIGHNEANQPTSVHTIDNKPYIFLDGEVGRTVARTIFISVGRVASFQALCTHPRLSDETTRPKETDSHQLSFHCEQPRTSRVESRGSSSRRFHGYLKSVKNVVLRTLSSG